MAERFRGQQALMRVAVAASIALPGLADSGAHHPVPASSDHSVSLETQATPNESPVIFTNAIADEVNKDLDLTAVDQDAQSYPLDPTFAALPNPAETPIPRLTLDPTLESKLLDLVPTPKNGEDNLVRISVDCQKGEMGGSKIAMCDNPEVVWEYTLHFPTSPTPGN